MSFTNKQNFLSIRHRINYIVLIFLMISWQVLVTLTFLRKKTGFEVRHQANKDYLQDYFEDYQEHTQNIYIYI